MNIIEADSDRLLGALRTVLARKGIAPPAEIAERIAVTDRASPAMGARMVAKAGAAESLPSRATGQWPCVRYRRRTPISARPCGRISPRPGRM